MFAKLFADGGLSLERLRAFIEVASAGSMAKAAGGDPVRQSQYSRQVKELEGFFGSQLIERHGKGIRLTQQGRELARISRFFLLGLSNFQRTCRAEERTVRIAASATFNQMFLVPALTEHLVKEPGIHYAIETASSDEIEARLHDLTLDFGVLATEPIARPLQSAQLGRSSLRLWAPRAMFRSEGAAVEAFHAGRLPIAVATRELSIHVVEMLMEHEPCLTCGSFLEAKSALSAQACAAVLPEFLMNDRERKACHQIAVPELDACELVFALAWSASLLRLDRGAARASDRIAAAVLKRLSGSVCERQR